MQELFKRSLSGIVFVAIMLAGICLHPMGLLLLALLINVGLLHEFYGLFKTTHTFNRWYYISLSTVIVLLSISTLYFDFLFASLMLIIAIIFLSFLLELSNKQGNFINNLSLIFTGWIYITFPLILFIYTARVTGEFSYQFTLSMLLFIWINDIFAYLTGSLLGKTKIFPNISPAKSLEGLIGGIIFTVGGAFVIHAIFDNLPLYHWLILACISSVGAIFGDLIESKIKRNLSIKDTGSLIPGHGGLLDRFDAFLFTIPFYFIYLVIFAG